MARRLVVIDDHDQSPIVADCRRRCSEGFGQRHGGSRGDRQGDREGRTRPLGALHRDAAAQHLAEMLGDRKTEPGAAIAPSGRGVGLAERLKQPAELFLAHADPGVGDDERQLASGLPQFQRDAAVMGELAGIA